MRTIQLHPFSLLTGVALALLAFVAMGQKPTGTDYGRYQGFGDEEEQFILNTSTGELWRVVGLSGKTQRYAGPVDELGQDK
jgi:hypothetical protein